MEKMECIAKEVFLNKLLNKVSRVFLSHLTPLTSNESMEITLIIEELHRKAKLGEFLRKGGEACKKYGISPSYFQRLRERVGEDDE